MTIIRVPPPRVQVEEPKLPPLEEVASIETSKEEILIPSSSEPIEEIAKDEVTTKE